MSAGCNRCAGGRTPCTCQLPSRCVRDLPAWDERTRIAATMGGLILANPEHEPLRLAQSLFDRAEATLERQHTLPNATAIAKAVDDWLLMERKARAWDELYARAHDDLSLLALMERLVQPAQTDV